MIKFRLYFDKDAEAEWLNKMAAEGYAMTGFFAGFYHFEECQPGKYEYQIDFGDKFFSVSEDYREFMRDTGVEIIQNWGYWVILRRLASEGKFELYTDVDSQIEHYSKIRKLFKVVTIVELICFFVELFVGIAENNVAYAWPFLLIIGAFILVMVNVVFKTNKIIAELQERKGEQPSGNIGRNMSALIPVGLLLNSCALLLQESVSHSIKIVIQILAIAFMLIGIYRTARIRKNNH